MGELSLLPAVRKSAGDTLIVADGTSCRHQIHDGAGRDALHVARVLAMSLEAAGLTPGASHNKAMAAKLLPTTLVGSYAQPDWLIDRQKLAGRFPPRVRAKELWRVAPEFLDAGAGRRHAARHPRPGARRPRHHHRRRACGAKAIPTASPPRSKASTSTIPERRSIAPAIPIRCRASPARCAASIRSRCATSNSCAPIPTA